MATTRQRIERAVARTLDVLPAAVQIRLAGGAAITMDGQTLAPELQLVLALLERRGEPALDTLTPEQARASRRASAVAFAGKPSPVGYVEDIALELPVALRARHYAPARNGGGAEPLLTYFHGGGFVFGDLDTHDGLCRLLCRHARAHVLAIDYRLAPEHPFPAAVEDACAAYSWALALAEALGADPQRVGVGGDSAGGNLAAVVAQQAAAEGLPAPALQLLIYPVTDFVSGTRSSELFADGFLLTRGDMDWFERHYLGSLDSPHARDVRASPLLAEDLSELAPAIVVTAGFDPLRDEGEAYAAALQAAGNVVVHRRYSSFIHAFVNATGVSRSSRDAVIEIAGMIEGVLGTARRSAAARS